MVQLYHLSSQAWCGCLYRIFLWFLPAASVYRHVLNFPLLLCFRTHRGSLIASRPSFDPLVPHVVCSIPVSVSYTENWVSALGRNFLRREFDFLNCPFQSLCMVTQPLSLRLLSRELWTEFLLQLLLGQIGQEPGLGPALTTQRHSQLCLLWPVSLPLSSCS